jgi:LacI family transcriptional regulator
LKGEAKVPVTIWDIAKHLDLSVSTVSRALNGYGDVAEKTRQRIVAATKELGYYPSSNARNLRLRETGRIGFSFSFPTEHIGEFAAELITGAVAKIEKENYNLLLYPLSGQQMDKLTRICRTREVTGLLLMGGEHLDEAIELLEKESMPFVVLNRRIDKPSVSYVTVDNVASAKVAVEHLISLGHKRIAYIGCPTVTTANDDRLTGYKKTLKDAGLSVKKEYYKSVSLQAGQAAKAMKELLELKEPPTAVYTIFDTFALECLEAIKAKGLRVPEDVALVGNDNLRLSLTTNPPLTTVHPPLMQIGKAAMQSLLAHIADEDLAPTRLELPATLIVRESTIKR